MRKQRNDIREANTTQRVNKTIESRTKLKLETLKPFGEGNDARGSEVAEKPGFLKRKKKSDFRERALKRMFTKPIEPRS